MIDWELLALDFLQFHKDKVTISNSNDLVFNMETLENFLRKKRHVHDIVDGRLVGQLLDTLVAGRISRMEATGR